MKKIAALYIVIILQSAILAQIDNSNFIRGVDISFTPQIEDLGGIYKQNGVVKDVLDIFKDNGVNYIRLRIWNNPKDGYCNLEKTLLFAKRIKEKGFKFLLDFHYSDEWADPGKQIKPAAWANLPFDVLKDSVYTYTKNVITALKNQNTLPDMVQVGNEISGGMLWPDGKIYGVGSEAVQWVKFADLVKQGIKGVKDAAGSELVKIIIHIDRGGDNKSSIYFYDHLIAQGVEFDVIGLSYYPWWHGTLDQLKNNLNDLAVRYQKEIVVAETAYPMNNVALNDGMPNVSFDPNKLIKGYTVSVAGQKDFLVAVSKIIKDAKNGKGIGYFYWEPAYISVPPIGSSWEYYTMFNPTSGEALNSLTAFKDQDSLKSIKVKIRLNTSTNSDTLKTNGVALVVGQINGNGTNFLPSGERITWDNNSQLALKNVDGDNWEYEFEMYPEDQIEFKFWTGNSKAKPTSPRFGWEGPITPFDSTNKNARLFNAGFEDTTLQIQYYNSTGDYVPQYFSPIQHKEDSIAVMFRVNLSDLTKKGLFDSTTGGPIIVRGDSISSAGILSWKTDNVILKREENSIADGSFWSGVVYFPKNKILTGTKIRYKFFAKNSSFDGQESGINERIFSFPVNDTTLAWKFFNDKILITDVSENQNVIPEKFELFQNFPNPFNPETVINYDLSEDNHVTLKIYDALGREVAILINKEQPAGAYSFQLSADKYKMSSGIYYYQLRAGNFIQTKKMMLVK